MKKFVVCDDNVKIIMWFQNVLQSEKEHLAQGIFEDKYITSLTELCLLINTNYKPDIIFLDILFGSDNGLLVMKSLRDKIPDCKIVLMSSSTDYFYQGYSIHAYDYLVKPLSIESVKKIIRNDISGNQDSQVTVKYRGIDINVDCSQLIYVESNKHNVFFHFLTQSMKFFGKLDDYEYLLKSSGNFIRCHQSYLVNLDFVDDISGKDIILKNKNKVPIRKADVAKMKARFYTNLFGG